MSPQKTKSNQKEAEKETRYPLKNIPADVYKILWREQAKLKAKGERRQFSLSLTVYHIIKEYDKMQKVQGDNT
jgi:hypothetical protein